MARAVVILLSFLALASFASATPCFHGGHRLTSAPITLKTNRKNGASSAHSSFDGVAEPVRESGYFKVREEREERKKQKRKESVEIDVRFRSLPSRNLTPDPDYLK